MFEKTGIGTLCRKKLELLLSLTVKEIPLKVFGRLGAGKITFFQKGLFFAKPFCNSCYLTPAASQLLSVVHKKLKRIPQIMPNQIKSRSYRRQR